MNIQFSTLRSCRLFLSLIIMVFFSTSVIAKEVNLYENADVASKIVGKIDIAKGIVPIFTKPDGTWMKVGDPRNGNVGWVKTSDLANTGTGASSFSYQQQIINDGKGVPRAYQVMQFGNDDKAAIEKRGQEFNKQITNPNNTIEQNIQSVIQTISPELNKIYQQQKTNPGAPIVMPIIVVPQQPAPSSSIKAP